MAMAVTRAKTPGKSALVGNSEVLVLVATEASVTGRGEKEEKEGEEEEFHFHFSQNCFSYRAQSALSGLRGPIVS